MGEDDGDLRARVHSLEKQQTEIWSQWNKHRDTWQDKVRTIVKEAETRIKENLGNSLTLKFISWTSAIVVIVQVAAMVVSKMIGV